MERRVRLERAIDIDVKVEQCVACARETPLPPLPTQPPAESDAEVLRDYGKACSLFMSKAGQPQVEGWAEILSPIPLGFGIVELAPGQRRLICPSCAERVMEFISGMMG